MRLSGITTRVLGALMVLIFAGSAFAQEMSVGTASGQPGGQATVSVDWTGDGTVDNITVWFEFDQTVITPQVSGPNNDVVGCLDGLPASHTGILTTCRNPAATPQRIVLVISDQAAAGSFPTTNVGNITFDIAGGATTGTTEPITVSVQEATDSSLVDVTGSVAESDGSVDIVDLSAVLNVQPPSINFPATENGSSSATQTITISNDGSDGIGMTVSSVSLATGTHFSVSPNSCAALPFTLSDGQSCTYDAVFSPTAIGDFNDTVTVTSDAGQVTNDQVALSGEGTSGPAANLAINPTSHDYGDVLTGETASFSFTVSNNGESGSSASIDTITPPAGDFTVTGGTCNAGSTTLANGASCTIVLEFAPAADGAQSGDLVVDGTDTVNSTALQVTSAIQGTGVTEARLAANPAPGTVNMGVIPIGGTLDQTVTLTNEGNAPLDVSCGSLNDPAGVFTLNPDPADFTGIAQDDASEQFEVSCTVPDQNTYTATLSCTSNDADNASFSYEFSCTARPLVVPTMQPWGLVVLTLIMLLVGGFSIRFLRA